MGIYRNWFLASRPWSFVMTFISVAVGTILASFDGTLNWGLAGLSLLAAVCLHGGANLLNDYFDVKSGLDTLESATAQYRPHPVVEGLIPPRQILIMAMMLFGTGALLGLYLVHRTGPTILYIGAAGLIAGVAYTAPPFKYKYWALGELSVLLMWGPLMVEGAYFVQRGALSLRALLVSLPFGLLVALVIFANNLRDRERDQRHGVRTLATLLGPKKGITLYALFIVLAYLGLLMLVGARQLPPWTLAALASFPVAFKILKQMAHKVPKNADALTAQMNTAYGALFLAALLFARLT